MYDVAETKRRGYSGKSKVYFDGRERLEGKDWINRKREVWMRGSGKCEHVLRVAWDGFVVRCSSEMHDPHHIIPRSVKRDDRLKNLVGLCRGHHRLLDHRKPMWGVASQLRNKRLLGVA